MRVCVCLYLLVYLCVRSFACLYDCVFVCVCDCLLFYLCAVVVLVVPLFACACL